MDWPTLLTRERLGKPLHSPEELGRYVDILIKNNKTGKVVAIEVKSGGAVRSKAQLAKDKIIADGKGIFGNSGKSTKGVTVSEARVPLWRLP